MDKELVAHHILRVVVNSTGSQWTPVTSSVLPGSLLGTMSFNIFNNDIDKGIKCTLNKFPDDTNTSDVIGTPGGWNDIQRDLDKFEKWQAATSMLKF